MDNRKYIGMDVHQASISIAVSDAAGKVLMECIIETKAATIVEFVQQPGDRDAEARGRHNAGGDHDRDVLAEAHHPGDAERGRIADEEAWPDHHQQ